jgi:hypothetical protein
MSRSGGKVIVFLLTAVGVALILRGILTIVA